ncbi:MAG: hypothetical protein ACREIA_21415 [Opitutaceae bacterium]
MKWVLLLGCALAFGSHLRGAEQAEKDAAPAAQPPEPAPAPEEIIAQLDGYVEPRPGGGWIQVKMDGVSLAVAFYNEKAEPVAPDVDRALARFIFPGREQQRRVLIPFDGGKVLKHGQPLRPPHVFKILLSFFRGESSEAVESYTIDYR